MTGVNKTVRVQVPATSANLGPGFDTLGLALDYYDEHVATVTALDSVQVAVCGEGANTLPQDESNLVARSAKYVFDALGIKMPGLKITSTNRIPHGRGMGSSGAAIVAGVLIAAGLLAPEHKLDRDQILQYATEIEGHPDNVAPAIFGALTISWREEQFAKTKQLQVASEIAPLILIPDYEVATKVARALQPDTVPLKDATFNVARAALLPIALTLQPELIYAATADKLHQSYRAPAMQPSYDLVQKLRQAGYAAVISGAGPTVLVLAKHAQEREAAAEFVSAEYPQWRQEKLSIAVKGATVEDV